LTNPDFAAMARAIGVHAIRVEDPGELEAAIADILAHDGPALLDVLTNPHALAASPQFPFWLAYTTNMSGSNFRKGHPSVQSKIDAVTRIDAPTQ
jgi:thiamine pyrophosphate-dependent acetolactate synthase large subunit-like protein